MPERPRLTDLLTLLLLSLVWGTSYILIKKGLEVFTPMQVAALRLGVSAVALLPLAFHHLRRVRWGQLPLLLVIGLTGTGLPSVLFPFAQTRLSSSLTGMLSSLTPLCTFLVAYLFFRARSGGRQKLLGVLLGLVGAVLLAWAAPGEVGQTTQFAYAAFIVLACLCYATSSNLVGAFFQKTSSLTITVASFFLVGLPAFFWSVTAGGVPATVLAAEGTTGWWALGYVCFLAIFSTVLASVLFFRLVQRTGAVFSSTVSYIIPLVALGWGVFDGESVALLQLPAIALILVGVGVSR